MKHQMKAHATIWPSTIHHSTPAAVCPQASAAAADSTHSLHPLQAEKKS